MPKCSYCGNETQLFANGVPICVACSEDLERGQPPSPQRELAAKTADQSDRNKNR